MLKLSCSEPIRTASVRALPYHTGTENGCRALHTAHVHACMQYGAVQSTVRELAVDRLMTSR